MSKVYVKVTICFDSLGKMTPLTIEWEDGRIYRIDQVLQVKRQYITGGLCLRYRVRIGKKTRNLYFESDTSLRRWFVEGSSQKPVHCCRDFMKE